MKPRRKKTVGSVPVYRVPKGTKSRLSPKKFLLSAVAAVLVFVLGVTLLPGLLDSLSRGMAIRIDDIGGQPYASRAVTISRGESEITLLVPKGISAGKK